MMVVAILLMLPVADFLINILEPIAIRPVPLFLVLAGLLLMFFAPKRKIFLLEDISRPPRPPQLKAIKRKKVYFIFGFLTFLIGAWEYFNISWLYIPFEIVHLLIAGVGVLLILVSAAGTDADERIFP